MQKTTPPQSSVTLDQALFFETLIDALPMAIGFLDPTGRYLRSNSHMTQLHTDKQAAQDSQGALKINPHLEDTYQQVIATIYETGQPVLGVTIPAIDQEAGEHIHNFFPVKKGETITAILEIAAHSRQGIDAMETLKHQALHDPLTGLPNRAFLKEKLSQMLANTQMTGESVGVLFLDLDRFKFINDTLGHAVGDLLLKAAGERLKNNIRQNDSVGRLGGDEFMVLLKDVKSSSDAVNVARKILRSIRPPFKIDEHLLHITTSIGISLYPHDGDDADMLLRNADTAMYRAKESGGNNLELYKPTMNTKAYEQLTLENSLREALDKNELTICYQPQVDLSSNEMVGVEALVHWLHPKLGLIFPTEFIHLAEETGLINPIGRWVIMNACLQARKWQQMGLKPIKIAVNLSDRQLKDPNLTRLLTSAISESGLDPRYLDLELTENIITNNAERAIKSLNSLKTLGMSISIDDFGTGYSSLSHLKKFPVDTLKIDRSFVKNSITDTDDAAIITAIISMAHRLRLKVIAEGVEPAKQLDFLRSLECDGIQGYLFSMPVTAETIEQFLKQGKKL